MSTPLVKAEHGPTLPELLGRRWRPFAIVVGVVAALIVAVALAKGGDGETEFIHRDEPQFNLRFGPPLKKLEPRREELLRLEHLRGDLFVQSFVVDPLTLPAYSGEPSGALPAFASGYAERISSRYESFQLVEETKARINDVPGYTLTFRAKLGERTLYGRHVLLVPDEEGEREGVVLVMLATPAAGIGEPQAVGARGRLKLPFRSFRFGTDPEGGE